jgi:hypothetical protein
MTGCKSEGTRKVFPGISPLRGISIAELLIKGIRIVYLVLVLELSKNAEA